MYLQFLSDNDGLKFKIWKSVFKSTKEIDNLFYSKPNGFLKPVRFEIRSLQNSQNSNFA